MDEPVPVGWFESPNGAFRANPLYRFDWPSELIQWSFAVYLHPSPQPLTLSDEQIDELAHEMVKGGKSANWLARAVLAAAQEKHDSKT